MATHGELRRPACSAIRCVFCQIHVRHVTGWSISDNSLRHSTATLSTTRQERRRRASRSKCPSGNAHCGKALTTVARQILPTMQSQQHAVVVPMGIWKALTCLESQSARALARPRSVKGLHHATRICNDADHSFVYLSIRNT